MRAKKNPEVDLKLQYRKTLELAFVVTLALLIGFFHAMMGAEIKAQDVHAKEIKIDVADIPQTQQFKSPPPPPRPSVPIPTESEDVPEDATIESTELNLDLAELPPPPPPGEGAVDQGYVFVPYDEPPVPIGGLAAIQRHLKYPEIARKAGLTATVIIGVLIDEHGNPIKTQVLKGAGVKIGFEEAARDAVMAVKWKPAKQRDRAVKVWVSIPIHFKVRDEGKAVS